MPKQPDTLEQSIARLREAEFLIARGKTVAQAATQISVTEQADYRWREGLSITVQP
jgi:hypothetical protein